ncbi:MAG TPA: sigma 54 modulation/S30EA ribosomal C-terminal domain-containing protein [Acidimicrobiia bacterium]|nr:sigma 54 modulation/S30EA ribosomal C-terminal domain-containing protein [Acidimicrobiia bacterium]
MTAESPSTEPLDVTIVLSGDVASSDRDVAEREIRRVASKASRPVIFARAKLTWDEARPPDEKALAQGTIDMSGTILRSQVAASTFGEAIEALAARLERRMRRVAERREAASQRPPTTPEGQWRSGDLPTTRPTYFSRPVEDRRIVQRKSFSPGTSSLAGAMFDMEVLDHRFFLFTDEEDGTDSVVFETADGVSVRRVDGQEAPKAERFGVGVDRTPVQTLDDGAAQERLDVSGAPFIFYKRAETGRGAVLYRRYDGHYGLIEPSA